MASKGAKSYLLVVIRIKVVLKVRARGRLHLGRVGVHHHRLLGQRRADRVGRAVLMFPVSSPCPRRHSCRGASVDEEPSVHVWLSGRLVVGLVQLRLVLVLVLGRVVRDLLLVAEQLVRLGLQLLRVRRLLPDKGRLLL